MGCASSKTMLRPLKQLAKYKDKQQNQQQKLQEQQPKYLLQVIEEHKEGINCLEISEDRSLLVTGGEDMTLRLWATMSNPVECIGILKGHLSYITCCAIYNCHIVSGSADKTLRLWSIEYGNCLAIFTGHQSVINHVVFDNKLIFSTSFDKTCRVWDIDAEVDLPKKIQKYKYDSIIDIEDEEYDNDDNDDNNDDIIDASKSCIRILEGHTKSVTQVVYIPHEVIKRPLSSKIHETDIIVTTSTDWTARTWSLETGECLKILEGHQGPINCIAVDTINRRQIYTGGADNVIKCWDTVTGDLVRELKGHDDTVLVLLSHNKILYSGSSDKTARAWIMEFGECTRIYWRNQGGVTCIKYYEGLCSCDTTTRIYDAKSGVLKRTYHGHLNAVTSLQVAPGKLFTGSYDGKICVWDCSNIVSDTVFGNIQTINNNDINEDSLNIRRAMKDLDPFIRNFK